MIRAAESQIGNGLELSPTGMTCDDGIQAKVRAVIEGFGKGSPGNSEDLETAGFSSLDFVNLMLTVEESFALKIPSARMSPANFRTINDVEALVRSLQARA